ncbi:hypothetical protein D3C72_1133880 [compost metagenome]
MRIDDAVDVFLGRFHGDGGDVALDHLGHFVADHVGADQGAGLGVEDDLDEAVDLARRHGLAVHAEREAADLDLALLGAGTLLGDADRGDLRLGVGAAGDGRMDVRRLVGGDVLGGVDAFVRRLVRQPGRAGAVADGVEALDVGLAVAVGLDVAAVQFDAQRLQADAVGVGGDADGRDADLGLQRLGLAVHFNSDLHTLGILGHLSDLGADLELDAALLERLLRGLGDLFVLDRHDAVDGFDDRHLGAQGAIEAGELDADGARADDDEGLGQLLGGQGVAVGPDLVAVRFQTDLRQGAGAGADGQHDALGLDGARAAGLQGDDDLGRRSALLERGRAFDHLDLVLLHQEADALVHRRRDPARALDDGVEVE